MSDLLAYTVSRRGTLLDAAEVIQRNHSRTAVVVDDGRVIGVLSEGDILRALLGGADVHAPLADFVQLGFRYLRSRDIGEALKLMHPRGITLLPVVGDDFKLEGVVTQREVIEDLLTRLPTP
jgi:CBS domain-containing protein